MQPQMMARLIAGLALVFIAVEVTLPRHAGATVSPAEKQTPIRELGRMQKAVPDEPSLVFFCTAALLAQQFENVDQSCGQAIALRPDDPQPHKLLGVSYLLRKRYGVAGDEFAEAVRLAPRDAGNRIGLAEALRGEGDYDGAISAFTVALSLEPGDAGAWNARCWTRGLFARDLKQGLRDCDRALKLGLKSADHLDSRGLIYLRLGNFERALRDYDAALAIKGDLATAVYGRGVTFMRLGRFDKGEHDIARARALNADVDDAFGMAPLLTRQCRSALFTSAAAQACLGREKPLPPKSGVHPKKPVVPGASRVGALWPDYSHPRRKSFGPVATTNARKE